MLVGTGRETPTSIMLGSAAYDLINLEDWSLKGPLLGSSESEGVERPLCLVLHNFP